MNSIKLLIVIAIVGAIAGFGILSNDIMLGIQSITVWDHFDAFSAGNECTCNIGGTDCEDLSVHGKELCGISP